MALGRGGPGDEATAASAQPSRRQFLTGAAGSALAAAALGASARRAEATMGPSSAAATSTVPQKKLNLKDLEGLSAKKVKQRQGALGPRTIEEILEELERSLTDLDVKTAELQREMDGGKGLGSFFGAPKPAPAPEGGEKALAELLELVESEKRQREAAIRSILERKDAIISQLEKERQFEQELKKRALVLKKLDAQPAWVNYAAAAAASVVSTCVMHPVDTIKTKMQVKGNAEERASDAADAEFFEKKKNSPLQLGELAIPEKKNPFVEVGELYRGLSGNIVKEAPSSALYLGVYEFFKTLLLATAFGGAHPLLVSRSGAL